MKRTTVFLWLALMILAVSLLATMKIKTRAASANAKMDANGRGSTAAYLGQNQQPILSSTENQNWATEMETKNDEPSILVETNGQFSDASPHLYDRSPTGGGLLFAKARLEAEIGADLWLQDADGRERFIAPEVVGAKFSPDGHKIAYANRRSEICIETVTGEKLAQIPRASEPAWRSDSAALSFLAVPSLDYPELQQSAIYDLSSNHVAELNEEK